MKQFNKTLIAAALMVAGSATANASIVSSTFGDTSTNEAYLVAYDSAVVNADATKGRTYNLNLGVTFAQLSAGNYTGLTKDLSSDANWTTFSTGMTSSAVYTVVDGSLANHGAFVSGDSTAPQANPNDPTQLIFESTALKIDQHAGEINVGLAAGANSSLIKQQPDDFTGQADHTLAGLPFAGTWTGLNSFNNLIAVGSTAQFYKGSFSFDTTTDFTGLGDFGTNVTLQSDITNIGAFTLAGNSLTFAPAAVSAVPLPAAVWMFGAGLMGVLRLNRRKSVQA